MRKNLFLIAFFVLTWISAMAVPAKPGFHQVTQSDGTTLTVQLVGDEWFSLTLTADNLAVDLGDDGDYYYFTTSGLSSVKAHDVARRSADEISFIEANKELMTVQAMLQAAVSKQDDASHLQTVRPKAISNMVPTQGDIYVPVILVNFKDTQMHSTHNTTAFTEHLMTKEKSVREYFYDQSNGKLNLHFEVFGPYELDNNISEYAKHRVVNGNTLNDAYRGTLVAEAINKAKDHVSWKRYCNDKNNSSLVNMVIVMCAGTNEAQGGGVNSIWPCEWSLSAAGDYPYYDGPGSFSVIGADGVSVTVNQFAILTEYAGYNTGKTLDGIGTFCHEFSHCLGLPDFYNTGDGHASTGLGDWSIMAHGCYNSGSNVPLGYSAYEKVTMGWLDYTDPQPGEFCTLPALNNTTSPNDKAYRIKGLFNGYVDYTRKRSEFWVIENRQRDKWDINIPSAGVLISQYVYDSEDWYYNRVNNPNKNLGFYEAKAIGIYGIDKSEFTKNSNPAMATYLTESGSVTTPPTPLDKPVTEITLDNGVASFYYMKDQGAPQLPKLSSPTLNAASNVQTTSFTASWSHTSDYACTYTLLVTQYGSTIREVKNITSKSITIDNLSSGETYVFKVKAVPVNSDATESDWSAQKEVTLDVVHTPVIIASPTSLSFTGFVGESYTQIVNVTGAYLSQDIAVELNDATGAYFIDKSIIGKTANGEELTITWSPKTVGTSNASIKLTSNGAQLVTIGISGDAQPATPTLMVDNNSLMFVSAPSVPKSKTISVSGRFITNNVNISLNDPGVFSVSPATIEAASLANGNSVDVTVTFASDNEGDFTGALTLSSEGAESKTIALTASASNGGNATDAYLNIANFRTINEAGAVVEDMESIYKYIEKTDEGIAWLTISNYGVVKVADSQKWITNEIEETYSIKNGWDATDIFLGYKSYFGDDATNGYSAKWRTSVNSTVSQFFYVTNCTQVKQLARNNLTNTDNLYMYIYECTKNADGTLNEGTTPIDVQKSCTKDEPEVLTSCDLEAEKIYKVEIRNSFSHLYEIGFKTELNAPVAPTATLSATPGELAFSCIAEETIDNTITIAAENLTDNVTVALEGDNVFTISKASITKAEAEAGAQVVVTFSPQEVGQYTGTVTFTSGNITRTVALSGEATAKPQVDPVLTVTPASLSFSTYAGLETSSTFTVSGEWISDDVIVSCDGEGFAVSTETIAASDLADGSVDVEVTFQPMTEGNFDGTVTLTSGNATQTVTLNGVATYNVQTPQALAATEIAQRSFVANWNTDSCPGATSYTLRVIHEMFKLVPKPSNTTTLLLSENFNNCDASNDEITDAYTDNSGWSGIRVYVDNKAVRVGGSSTGSLSSPDLDLTNSNGKVSVRFFAKTYSKPGNYQYQSADNPLKISCNGESQTITVPSTNYEEFTVVLPCEKVANQKITFANTKAKANVIIDSVRIYSGDISVASLPAGFDTGHGTTLPGSIGSGLSSGFVVVIVRDTTIYTGITENHYKLTGLAPMNNYTYDVKAVYGSQESGWSNSVGVITKKKFTPLDDLVVNGRVGNEFVINDGLIVVHVKGSDGLMWCKSVNNTSIDATEIRNGQIDFMRDIAGKQVSEWDQSNWILLQFPADDGSNGIKDMLEEAVGKIIPGGTVAGLYTDDVNYSMAVLPVDNAYSLELGDEASYMKNYYCTANFLPSNLNVNGGAGALDRINGEDVYYFFMNPKVQEVCEITSAQFDGDGVFVNPLNNGHVNGSMKVDWSYNANGAQEPVEGKVYSFTAVVNRQFGEDGNFYYVVYPLDFDTNSGTVTGIGNIDGCNEAIGVEYVNVAGLVSDKPFKGVNIVVTHYRDGSTTVVKKLYK